jgi:hypothetical protein
VYRVVTQVTAPDWPSFIEKSTLRGDSFLARLSDDDFQQGMAALRTPGNAINQNDAVTEEIDWYCPGLLWPSLLFQLLALAPKGLLRRGIIDAAWRTQPFTSPMVRPAAT